MNIISIFNNKGGVGKTTYMFHIAHLLAENRKKVLMVDLDSQCNLSAYSVADSILEASWRPERGNSIWNVIEPVYEGIGDFRKRQPTKLNDYLYIVPGDVLLSSYEDSLGDTWSAAKGGNSAALRVQSAIYRYVLWAAEHIEADLVLFDLGPNLGALNRVVLAASNYFIVPMSPDLFSIRGTENLGKKLIKWGNEWDQCRASSVLDIQLPNGRPIFLGYVMQQHNLRNNASGMTQGWNIFGNNVEEAVQENIVELLRPTQQVYNYVSAQWNLGLIPNLHSLIPYSQNARKPVFDCTYADGLRGAHIGAAQSSRDHFFPIINKLLEVI